MKKHRHGFTLAEVLITLVIIGIIAAMTIPTLMNKTNEQETVVAVKKAFSVFSQAYQRMVADYGEIHPSYFGSTEEEATKNFGDEFVKYLNVQKVCGTSTGGDCWSTKNGGVYKWLNGDDWYSWNNNSDSEYLMSLSDGCFVAVKFYNSYLSYGDTESLQKVVGYVYVDVNGDKDPNTGGRDLFKFWITKYGIIPTGMPNDTQFPFSNCKTSKNGLSCAAWVITKGNMDYLRKDVSW